MHTLILGAGYSGRYIALESSRFGSVCGTRRSAAGVQELSELGISGCVLDGSLEETVLAELARATHLIVCVAPGRELPLNDPILNLLKPVLARAVPMGKCSSAASLQWIGYLSTIGVYGDYGGAWVDEQSSCRSEQLRSQARREAELAWQAMARDLQLPISILRLSGIYGPGRNAILDAMAGRARMLIKPGQYFNRIHVEDLAAATTQAALRRFDGVLNITDDHPSPPQDVIRHAHELIGKPPPVAQPFESAEISAMARSFYSENKRVRNTLGKRMLSYSYRYPSYREGLGAIYREIAGGSET